MPIERVCLTCEEKFLVPPSHIKIGGGKFCSRNCYGKSIRKPLPEKVPKDIHQVMLGSLLGDGCVNLHKKYLRYCEGHAERQLEYLKWKYKIYQKIIHISPINFRYSQRTYRFGFSYINFLKPYYKMFYPNGKKVVTKETLNQLTPLGLAVWIMDDGSYDYSNDCLTLCTHCFGFKGNEIVQAYFKEVWNLNSKIYKQGKHYAINFNKINIKKLAKIVKPHIHPTMTYKIGSDIEKSKRFKQRVSISKKRYYQKNKEKIIKQHKEYRQRPEIRRKINSYNKIYIRKYRQKQKMLGYV